MQEYEKYSIKKNQKINELYRNKLKAMREKEKDINVLINMIYIFLENLILYLRINLGININEKKEKKSERNKNDINPEYSDNKNNNNQYFAQIKKIKKLNLELSFQKYLKKFSYLFKFKNISFSTDFSYLSNKYILTDESIFFDFLGQIYSFLFHIIPKSQGFEISYSIINDNKLKILFQKISKSKKGYRNKKPRKSNLFILCEDKFKATSSVKTSDMNQEILYKLAELLGIKLKIMEYEDQNQDIYLTLIIPYSLDDDNDLLCSETDENPLENIGKISNLAEVAKRNIIQNNDEEEINNEDNYNISKNKNNIKTSDIINLKPMGILKSLSNIRNSKGFLNSNYSSALMVDHIENIDERNSSEEDVSSRKAAKEKKENENQLIINKRNSNNMSFSSISKSSLHIPGVSILSNIQKMSNTPVSDKNFTGFQFKDLSTNYLNEVNPSFMPNDNNISKDNIHKENINKLSLIHQKYSNLEKLKRNGVEILIETENHNIKDNNNNIYLDSISSCDNNTSFKDKKSLNVEADSDNFVEFENEDDFVEEDPLGLKKNESNSIINNKNSHKNNSVLLNLNYTHNNGLSPKNEKYALRNRSLFVANKRSNKTLIYNKKSSNDSLFVIPEINENYQKNITKISDFQRIDGSPPQNCNCKDILLVDDDEFILKTSKNILKAFKLEADCAENGQECLNMIKEKQEKNCNCSKSKYKIILMDITMPVMDGIEAAKNIQKLIDENKLYDTIKIIFISAHVNLDLSTILSGIKCAIDYYAKPISGVKYKS
jgi:CheY-like chemotaxis protein